MTYNCCFRSKQEDKLNEAVTKFTEDQKKAVAETERAALLQRQELIREREKKIWDTEEAHLQEKHQTARSQLKDQFLLQVHTTFRTDFDFVSENVTSSASRQRNRANN